jgi:hypothetical protein
MTALLSVVPRHDWVTFSVHLSCNSVNAFEGPVFLGHLLEVGIVIVSVNDLALQMLQDRHVHPVPCLFLTDREVVPVAGYHICHLVPRIYQPEIGSGYHIVDLGNLFAPNESDSLHPSAGSDFLIPQTSVASHNHLFHTRSHLTCRGHSVLANGSDVCQEMGFGVKGGLKVQL